MKPSAHSCQTLKTARFQWPFLVVLMLLAAITIIFWLLDPSNRKEPNYRVGWPAINAR